MKGLGAEQGHDLTCNLKGSLRLPCEEENVGG